ncbi:MAG: DUF2283 domain-containing protein [Patescibacteria group bacterium]
MKNEKTKISYEPEADVLRIEISKKPIDYVKEMGNFIVHFGPNDLPVYLEILEAKKFIAQTKQIFERTKILRMPEFAGRP